MAYTSRNVWPLVEKRQRSSMANSVELFIEDIK